MPEQVVIAGLGCGDVLGHLSEYVDGTVSADLRSSIEEHLRGCDWCARFGGEFSAVVTELRSTLKAPSEPAPDISARLANRLDELFDE
ncbi:MAG: zf-HC2 domain-containing protein [Deltaproteobacteria bacterium]|nr:zf-HC2 domain-containing protein [Deltaproteobacteria bacterium]